MTTELDGCIHYHEGIVKAAKMLGGISQEVLEALTVKYLKELKAIKDKEEVTK